MKTEREMFLEWHFLDWKLHNAVTDTMDFAKVLYDRVYSHDHTSSVREVEFKAWQASQQGEVDKLQTKIDEVNEKHSEEKRILHNVIEMNQAKIDELKKLRSLDEMAINQLAQANQVWQIKCDELQKRIDDASNKIDFWVGGKNGDAIHVAKSIGNILKGNKDEN